MAAIVGMLWLALAAPALAVPPDDFYAVNVGGIFPDGRTTATSSRQLGAIAQAGIPTARSDATWIWVEPFPPRNGGHSWRWQHTDTVVGNLARNGIRWLPVLAYSATWDRSDMGLDHGE